MVVGPPESAVGSRAPNHLKLLRLRVVVVSVEVKAQTNCLAGVVQRDE